MAPEEIREREAWMGYQDLTDQRERQDCLVPVYEVIINTTRFDRKLTVATFSLI